MSSDMRIITVDKEHTGGEEDWKFINAFTSDYFVIKVQTNTRFLCRVTLTCALPVPLLL